MTEVNYIKNKVYLCIDAYENEIISGRFYHIGVNKKTEFVGIAQLLIEMENLYDSLNYPESSTKHRTFSKMHSDNSELLTDTEFEKESKNGKLSTFIVHVIYRQNATWQGNLTWVEESKNKTFRSDIEFIKLINNSFAKKSV